MSVDEQITDPHFFGEGDFWGLFARMRQDGQPDGALLDIHDARSWIALSKDLCCGFVLDALQSYARPINCLEWFERRCGF